MKNIFYLLLLMPLMVLVNSCDDKKEIVFDSELPQFEIKDNAILLEVIMPQGTDADENIYIVGDFNDGENAVGQLEWRLEKAGKPLHSFSYLHQHSRHEIHLHSSLYVPFLVFPKQNRNRLPASYHS